MGAVTGQLPVPLPAFFSPSSPPPPPLSVHPQVTELPSGRGGGDEEIKRKLHRVLLFDKTREVESWKLQTTFEKTGSGRREGLDKRRTEREKDRKGHMGFEVMVDEGRETEREVN